MLSIVAGCVLVVLLFSSAQATPQSAQDKVSVGFYAEALCPYCAMATSQVVAPLFQNGLFDYIDFVYVPYGNAKNSTEGLACQHGPAECRLNRVFACAIDQGKKQDVWFPFLQCVEDNFGPSIEDYVEECAEKANLDFVDISECASGAKGDELERAAREETDSLVPKHTYVPWLVVEGVPLLDGYANLQTFICVALPPDGRPDVCLSTGDDGAVRGLGQGGAGGLAWLLWAGRDLKELLQRLLSA